MILMNSFNVSEFIGQSNISNITEYIKTPHVGFIEVGFDFAPVFILNFCIGLYYYMGINIYLSDKYAKGSRIEPSLMSIFNREPALLVALVNITWVILIQYKDFFFNVTFV